MRLETDADRIAYLDAVSRSSFARNYKALARRLLDLRPGQRVLDAGCGPGDDARALAAEVGSEGRVVGVDHVPEMIAEATRRSQGLALPVDFCVGDVTGLDFPDESFDRCQIDRVLQLLGNRQPRALAELVRVTRAGGLIVASNPAGRGVLEVGDRERTEAILARGLPGGFRGDELPELFVDCGLVNVKVEPYAHWWDDFAEANAITPMDALAARAVKAGALSERDRDEWLRAVDRAVAADRFTFISLVLSVRGERP